MEQNNGVVLSVWNQLKKYGLVACFVGLVAWPSVTGLAFSLGLTLIIIGKRSWKQRVGLLLLLVAVEIGAGIYYRLIPGVISNLSAIPLVEHAVVEEHVYLGGDDLRLVYDNGVFQMTSCFYTDEGLLVAGGHECSLDGVVGEPKVRTIMANRYIHDFVPDVLEETPAGLVLGPVDRPRDRPQLPIAGSDDVKIGENATVYSVKGGIFEVTILGYHLLNGSHCLLFQVVDPQSQLIEGMSGSPVVQDGKIIGFFVAKISVSYRGSSIGFARVAAEVYEHTVGSR